MTDLVFYLVVFLAIGVFFLFIHLLIGKFIRPYRPDAEKMTIYECGEPTVGSAWIQFDLRYYVVALLFVIFDVEVAFFFPWAVVFGQANAVAQQKEIPVTAEQRRAYDASMRDLIPNNPENQIARAKHVAGDEEDRQFLAPEVENNSKAARSLAWIALFDILVFFGVLLVGFAYLWKRGDLAWVRSVSSESVAPVPSVVKEEPRQLASAGTSS